MPEYAKVCDIIIDMKPTFGHCGIVTGNFRGAASAGMPRGQEVLHATNSGVVNGTWGLGRAFCFRSKALTRSEGQDIQQVAEEIQEGTRYGIARAVFKSWTGSSSFGRGAEARLKKYQARKTANDQQIMKNVYCSELVVVAYQLGLGINKDHDAWIDLDGMHTLPRTLKTWLEQHSQKWTCVGMITDESLELSPA